MEFLSDQPVCGHVLVWIHTTAPIWRRLTNLFQTLGVNQDEPWPTCSTAALKSPPRKKSSACTARPSSPRHSPNVLAAGSGRRRPATTRNATSTRLLSTNLYVVKVNIPRSEVRVASLRRKLVSIRLEQWGFLDISQQVVYGGRVHRRVSDCRGRSVCPLVRSVC